MGASSFIDPDYCITPVAGEAPRLALQDKAPTVASWHERLVLLAQYLFWGVWWPFVILSIMLVGRVWCGVLCPEGALAEFASRHGRGGAIPRWMRWSGWPFVAFVLTTVYGQLISVYEYPQAALLVLGGSTVAAVGVGYLYGRGKRVWCRYLCPVTGVFALLARLAPLHFKVDRDAWNRHPRRTPAVDCAPLLSVSHLDGMAQCHACGRCSGHRDAVQLAARSPNAEILGAPGDAPPGTAEALLLQFGMLGVAIGAFQWTISPWFVQLKQAAAEWLVEREIFWPLQESPAWWLLTRHPEANDVFTWLDGATILAWLGGVALVLGGSAFLATLAAARLAGLDWRRLALGLVPLAGIGLFLGLSMMTATHLRAEGIVTNWLPGLRAALLAVGVAWSARLGWRLIKVGGSGTAMTLLAAVLWLLPLALVATSWWLVFFIW
ncbi:MAG: 4Fe-4S binding protein [Gammaproteobacteria bacterium]|nr:4Fe-4S binding protein [Gammaproteobacteria bacterium]MBU1644970.1 4Fe-4S binding protein [Gammaproteobacteria bacterium]MBU1971429.1 4Fe-4S binding protein [Gammaproteobacteria bacterium]